MKPVLAGSAGGNDGGAGGGVIYIETIDSIHVFGAIVANGADCVGSNACGGGSGGSITIITPFIDGGGRIEANGGAGSVDGFGGGGGRIHYAIITGMNSTKKTKKKQKKNKINKIKVRKKCAKDA
eukprot:Phypoly_transcript_24746.p1 GENE.Phypoly_transcript_24746~~Phypoly_transcript_24746.p1  ORF type:complete len:139 (+),score=33.28 Phypoly_transcript_24746:43-417(+)